MIDDDWVELEEPFRLEAEPQTNDPDATSLDGQTQSFLKRQSGVLVAGKDWPTYGVFPGLLTKDHLAKRHFCRQLLTCHLISRKKVDQLQVVQGALTEEKGS
jgi:hypothetical protein